MSGAELQTRQSFFITPPRSFGSGPGEIFCVATSTTASALDVRSLGLVAANQGTGAGRNAAIGRVGALGSFISIYADGADLGIITGPTYASVTGANAPNLANVGTVNGAGIYTNVAGVCGHVPVSTFLECNLEAGYDIFIGFVAGAAGKIRIYQNSSSEA